MKKLIIIFVLCNLISSNIFSQVYKGSEAERIIKNTDIIRIKTDNNIPDFIHFKSNSKITVNNAIAIINNFFKKDNIKLGLKKVQNNCDKSQTYRYYQTLNDIIVEFSSINIQVKNNNVYAINATASKDINCITNFSLSETLALEYALNSINAKKYMWEDEKEEASLKKMFNDNNLTYYPKGEKVILPLKTNNSEEYFPAYKFNIFSLNPYNHQMVYVDANTGAIIYKKQLLQSSDEIGTAITGYYGERTITTENTNSVYILNDNTRGGGIHTYNSENTVNYNNTDFIDDDNYWNNANTNLDQYATDAHFATEKTYDYYLDKHNYHSIDNNNFPLNSYIHFDISTYMGYQEGYNVNAFWNGYYMTYGDGSEEYGISPLTTIDICGHEITHGLTNFTSDLNYANESGALNEAFSDIFGACIEIYAIGNDANWTIGEAIGYTMRSIENPTLYGNPRNYKGNYWDYSEEVHRNSGPLSHWFYLLVTGQSGINDFGNSYNIQGIGLEKAELIAFRTLTIYLMNNSDYEDVCFYAIQAASDLYGGCSPEVQSVGDAFYAIGVLNAPFQNTIHTDFHSYINENCTPQGIQFFNNSYNCENFLWDFGDGETSTDENPYHYYSTYGSFNVKLTASGNSCGTDSIVKNGYIRFDNSYPCNFICPQGNSELTDCNVTIFDSGGPYYNYSNNTNSTINIHVNDASQLVFNVEEFNVEANIEESNCSFDYLQIIGGDYNETFCNINPPPGDIIINDSIATIIFFSDVGLSYSGFKINYYCIGENLPPSANFSADNTLNCNGIVNFIDASYGEINSYYWDFGDGHNSTEQSPTHTYAYNGTYTVSLTVTNDNGENTISKSNFININGRNESLLDTTISVCENESITINLSDYYSNNAKWFHGYNNLINNTASVIGNTITMLHVNDSMTLYVYEDFPPETYYVGESDSAINGTFCGPFYTYIFAIFDTYKPMTLKSLLINAENSGDIEINLININYFSSQTATAYASYTGPISGGIERLYLNFDIPIGNGWMLMCSSSSRFFRAESDSNNYYSYPYYLPGIINIKGDSDPANPNVSYSYFFNWEIEVPGCRTELTTVNLEPIICINNDINTTNTLNIYPNPSNNIIWISNIELDQNNYYFISDINGRILKEGNLVINNIDISDYLPGIYYLEIRNDKITQKAKIIKFLE